MVFFDENFASIRNNCAFVVYILVSYMSTATWSKSSNQQPQKSEVKTNSAGQKKDVSTKKPTVSNTTAGEKPKSDVAVKPSKENEVR